MHARFQAAEAQQEDGGAARLSLLGMAERLSRMDAAKLFYQALGGWCCCCTCDKAVGWLPC